MENIANLIDEMIIKDIDFDEIYLDDVDMNISALLSNLRYEIQLIDDIYFFKSNLKELFFKYQDKFIVITFENGYLIKNIPNRCEYSICIYDKESEVNFN